MKKVVIPAAPGALSALGILDAELRREVSRTVMLEPESAKIEPAFRVLEAEARRAFVAEGARPRLTRVADLRYHGQGFELRVPWSARAVEDFHLLHAQHYGYADRARAVEVVTLRVLAVVHTPAPCKARVKMVRGDGRHARLGAHRVFEGGAWRRGALYDRAKLRPGEQFTGPAVVTELSATTYVAMGWTARVDAQTNLILEPAAKRGGGR